MFNAKQPSAMVQAATSVAAAFIAAAFTAIACSSFAALIFTGPLAPFLGQGIWIGLFTALVVGVIVALASSCPGVVAIPQDRIAPILAILAGSVVARMETASAQEKCLAVLMAIAVVSLITGFFLYFLGRLRLGNLIRYIPYPVVGGFLAGSGWLLVWGGVRVMTGKPLSFATLPMLLQGQVAAQLLFGAFFAAALFGGLKWFRHPLTFPGLLLCAIAAFWICLKASGASVEGARDAGWLPGYFSGEFSNFFSSISVLTRAPWHLLLQEWSIIATILLTSVVSILLTASALEVSSEQELDLNRELRAAGIATFTAGIGGGMVGFHSLSMSRLVLSMGARSRWVGVGSGLLCGLGLVFGPVLVSLVPQFVCGGLLVFLGLTFLWEWLVVARKTLTPMDYAVVVLILAVVATLGYPQGVGVGILAAVTMFIHNYSRVEVVTHSCSGAELRSHVDRSVRELRLLRDWGAQIYVLRLQGFIFFGTANHLLHEVRMRASAEELPPLKFVILDFARVTGLDASAIFSLNKVSQLARREDFRLLMTQVSPKIVSQLTQGGAQSSDHFKLLPDLDYGLEWCEDRLLEAHQPPGNGSPRDLRDQLRESWPSGVDPSLLLPYLERLQLPAATHLIRQSENSEALYFLEAGRVTARLELNDGRTLRLRTMGPGTVVGEVGLFLRGKRAASVVTDEPCTVYRLSAEALERMNREQPPLALALHRYLICLLGERLTSSTSRLKGAFE
jgi:SulP family sulfate permease